MKFGGILEGIRRIERVEEEKWTDIRRDLRVEELIGGW